MGNCPSGFQSGLAFTCHVSCPNGFMYAQDGEPPIQKCVSTLRSDRFITLNALHAPPMGSRDTPPIYTSELTRFNQELEKMRAQFVSDNQASEDIRTVNNQHADFRQQYGRVQGEYAVVHEETDGAKKLKEVTDSLKPLRPPTAPASDLEEERKKITEFQSKSLLFIQVVLALIVLVLIGYLVLPSDYAHGLAFLLLSVAISFGFFLRR